jgi:hypothetical protein
MMQDVTNKVTEVFHGKRSLKRPSHNTALHNWMFMTGRTNTDLAREVSARMSEGKSVTARQVARWRKGWSTPRRDALKILWDLSEGAVDANSFVPE